MELRSQDKEIEMPKTTSLGYTNPPDINSSSPKLSSLTVGERSDQQQSTVATTIFTHNSPHSSEYHNHHLHHHHHPLQSQSLQQQSQRTRRDPDPSSSPVGTKTLTSTPVVTFTAQTTTTTSSFSIRYRECLRNYVASMGCHVVDGCGEFMPCGEEGTPESLRCAACDCHRNFHRKETGGDSGHYNSYPNQNRIPSHPHRFSHGMANTSAPPVMMAFRGGLAESSSEDLDMLNGGGQISVQPAVSKRFRTRFTQQQKDRMMEFAEKLGWKIQKHDEPEVQQFCSQVGVKRQVFKVWMHNNKHAMKKQQM